jgi:hypothetical protein
MNTPVKSDESAARYCNCADPENCVEQIPGRLCKRLILPPIPVKSEATPKQPEYAGYRIEHVPTYYLADTGELRPYENHGLPGDELLCKHDDLRQLFDSHSALLAQISELQAENQALRNLANNLQPGPISEALAGTRYARESELVKALEKALTRLEVAVHREKDIDVVGRHVDARNAGAAALAGVTKEQK